MVQKNPPVLEVNGKKAGSRLGVQPVAAGIGRNSGGRIAAAGAVAYSAGQIVDFSASGTDGYGGSMGNQWTGMQRKMEALMVLGIAIGKVEYIMKNKTYNILVVTEDENKNLIPNIPEFIINIDLENKRIDVKEIPGLINEN